jgi:hypothetical protein
MNWRTLAAAIVLASAPGMAVASPGYYYYGPWSATLYAGPSTNSHFSRTLQGNFRANGGMAGLAGDVRLFGLGDGFSFGAEGQVGQFGGKHTYTTGSLGVGFRYDSHPWSFAFYSGPSYATDPPREPHFRGKALLNGVEVELAYAIPHSDGWGVALRMYHRSGAWGLYSEDDDEGTMFGIGVRKQF